MAISAHIQILKRGAVAWNRWRADHFKEAIDLAGADLHDATLKDVDLRRADLRNADLRRASLDEANLSDADLSGADLERARLDRAYLLRGRFVGTNMSAASLRGSVLMEADFSGAKLSGADLRFCQMVRTSFKGANLNGCRVYGTSVWDANLTDADQSNLILTDQQPTITVDNLEVAQFLYLLLNNHKLRQVIDTITSKVVLILGRFTPERKAVLDAIRDELRKRDYLPVLFDFEKPANRDITGERRRKGRPDLSRCSTS